MTEWERMRDQRESWPGQCVIDDVVVDDAEAELTGTPSKVWQRVDIGDRAVARRPGGCGCQTA